MGIGAGDHRGREPRCKLNARSPINPERAACSRRRILGVVVAIVTALGIAGATTAVTTVSSEHAMYGWEGPVEQNWRPRELGGWPAPFLADSPDTSVPHQLGLEDDFRFWGFVATWSFWYVVVAAIGRAAKRAPWFGLTCRPQSPTGISREDHRSRTTQGEATRRTHPG